MPNLPASARRSESGFTLIELLIVVVIIGILVAIAIPKFSNSKERAIISQMRSDLRNMVTAQESYLADAAAYYNGPIPGAGMAYGPSQNVTITLSNVTTTGWQATAARCELSAHLHHLHGHGCRATARHSAWCCGLYPVARG